MALPPIVPGSTRMTAALAQSLVDGINIARDLPTWGTGNRSFDPSLSAYNLRPDNLPRWRSAKARAAAGLGQAHVATLLDSITHGSQTATSNPKSVYAWPSRMRNILQGQLGDGGTGVVIPWDSLPNTPGVPIYDTRFKFAGAVTDVGYGVYSKGAKRITGTDGTLNHIEFTATCDEIVVYHLTSSGGNPRVSVDGGTEGTIRANSSSVSAVTYTPDSGYWNEGTNLGILVTRIPVTQGLHTIRLMAPSSSGTCTIIGIEGRNAGKGIRVSNLAQSGRTMGELSGDDTTNHFAGMSITFDTFRPDLSILLCAMNDYQGHSPVATFKSRVATVIDRQRATGSNAANGDIILVTCPQPNYAAPIPADGLQIPPLSSYFTALYELADEKDVPLLDLAWRWKDYSTSNALGFFGDALHPGNLGSSDIAQAAANVLLRV